MQSISSIVVSSRVCGVFVKNTAGWFTYGEQAWSEMMKLLDNQPAHLRIMGIDGEWFCNSPLAVVQFATASHCFVLHLSYFTGRDLPDSVKNALRDPSIIKCGVGISGDVSRLQKEQNVVVQSVLDLAHYSVALGLHDMHQTNLKVLAASVANLTIEKNKYITRSNWELPLAQSQINYAAEDALASFLIGEAIMRKAYIANNMVDRNFDVSAWLKTSASLAAQAFKKAMRQKVIQKRNQTIEKPASNTDNNSALAVQLSSRTRVAVLDKTGHFLFECSPERAKFYVMEKGLAKITKYVNENSKQALEIQFLFDPKVKTRLCVYNSLGTCELQGQCPFAHGIDELQPEARALLTSTAPSCACCLGTKGLIRHAVIPPSFRRCLPQPYKYPHDDDFESVCTQCNSILRHCYDAEMNKCYKEAELVNKGFFNIIAVSKCTAYASLLSDEGKLRMIPESRQVELKNYIRENWEKTYFRGFYPDFVVDEPLELSRKFLNLLQRIVPGEARSRATINVLVGNDPEKTKAFIQRWKDFCFQKCGMIKKESNHMSYNDWKEYRAHSKLPQECMPETKNENAATEDIVEL